MTNTQATPSVVSPEVRMENPAMILRLPIVPVPKQFRVQPIDPAEVGARLVDLALGPPSGRVPEQPS